MQELELTGEHVAGLGDEDLRLLVIKLSEAELRRAGRPSSAVIAGGNQTAADGGVDVRIRLDGTAAASDADSMPTGLAAGTSPDVGPSILGVEFPPDSAQATTALDFVPRMNTGFQVKCEDMAASAIASEMRPKGVLRDSIKELIACKGAYVIVSSKGTVADAFLAKRLKAMRDAVADQPGHADLKVEFYDRERLARWVREYAGVEMWLRGRVNARLQGWQGYGAWARAEGASYLLDETARLVDRTGGSAAAALPVGEGLGRLRAALRQPGQVLRLVGLSGTGKTSLVQALFESGVGKSEPLDQALVLYTDLGNDPEPSAREMLLRLGASERRAIVVVDNCNPQSHRILAELVSQPRSHLSLLTVEYDVADDDAPDATDVYELAPASDKVLEEILERLAPHISGPDRNRIVEFSGGNARIALALARTVAKGETLGVLNDTELFRRLFRQGQDEDPELLRAAQVCSLVYSFDGDDTKSDTAELKVLAQLAEMTPKELYRHVTALKRRDLVQSRGRWRAALPPAFANRLAKLALEELPASDIIDAFKVSDRLLVSFSRRLQYLHDCEEACAIADRWMNDEGWLANPAQLEPHGRKLFFNLAPLVPDTVLGSLERALEKGCNEFVLQHKDSMHEWATLLRHLAYEPGSFDRAAPLLLRLAEHEESNKVDGLSAWKEMFRMGLSGTLAPPLQRVQLLERFLTTSSEKRLELVWAAVDAMLEAGQISSSHDFSFGARPSGFGWEPATHADIVAWFDSAFSLIRHIAGQGDDGLRAARQAIASRFREVWSYGVNAQLAALMIELSDSDGWPAGWVAIRTTLQFDRKWMSAEALEAIKELDVALAPKGLAQEVRTYALGHAGGMLDITDAVEESNDLPDYDPLDAMKLVDDKVVALGAALATDNGLLQQVLPDLFSDENARQRLLGLGLGEGTKDAQFHWNLLREAFVQAPGSRNVAVLAGFVLGLRVKDPASASQVLESIVGDSRLDEFYPLVLGVPQDDADGSRLIASMKRAVSRPYMYFLRTQHGSEGGLSVAMFCEAMDVLSQMEDGLLTAIDQLCSEFSRWKAHKLPLPQEQVQLSRSLLARFVFDARTPKAAWRVNELAKVAFMGPEAAAPAAQFASRFAAALEDYRTHGDDYGDLAGTLFKLQPLVALEAFLSKPSPKRHFGFRARFVARHGPVVQCAPNDVLLEWVSAAPDTRAARLAQEINIFASKRDVEVLLEPSTDAGSVGLSPLATRLLELAPDKAAVLQGFGKHFHPTHWVGSLAQTLAPHIRLLEGLVSHPDSVVATWAQQVLATIQRRIREDRTRDFMREQSFE